MQQTNPSAIKTLSIFHLALFVGQVLFAIIFSLLVYTSNSSPSSPLQSYSNQLIILCIAIGIAGYLGGNILFRKKLEQINGDSISISEKFNDYRTACITRWALMEFSVLFSIILFFCSRISALLFIAVAFLLLFLTMRPSLEKAASDLGSSEEEIEQMNTGSSL